MASVHRVDGFGRGGDEPKPIRRAAKQAEDKGEVRWRTGQRSNEGKWSQTNLIKRSLNLELDD